MVFRRYGIARGDTIVEVMFAIAVFALVATGSLAVMNRGVQTTQRSLEITQVRQAMNDQAEVLRYIQQNALAGDAVDSKIWNNLIASTNTESTASKFGLNASNQCPSSRFGLGLGSHPFVIDPSTMQPETSNLFGDSGSVAYPQIVHDKTTGSYLGTYGLWDEAVKQQGTTNFVDFNIRACWDAPGGGVPVTLGTVVRLYVQ